MPAPCPYVDRGGDVALEQTTELATHALSEAATTATRNSTDPKNNENEGVNDSISLSNE